MKVCPAATMKDDMAIHAAIYHLTHYRYDRPVRLSRRSSG